MSFFRRLFGKQPHDETAEVTDSGFPSGAQDAVVGEGQAADAAKGYDQGPIFIESWSFGAEPSESPPADLATQQAADPTEGAASAAPRPADLAEGPGDEAPTDQMSLNYEKITHKYNVGSGSETPPGVVDELATPPGGSEEGEAAAAHTAKLFTQMSPGKHFQPPDEPADLATEEPAPTEAGGGGSSDEATGRAGTGVPHGRDSGESWDDEDDEPVALADLGSEGTRPMSDLQEENTEAAPDLTADQEAIELDEADT